MCICLVKIVDNVYIRHDGQYGYETKLSKRESAYHDSFNRDARDFSQLF